CTSFSYVLLRLNRRLQTESTAPDDSPWAKEEFSENYLDNADIYIVERRRMFRLVASLYTHFFRGSHRPPLSTSAAATGC
ncbi:MAG: hypothetical protein MZU97_08960, partial [Bacillus subtilis]|nr:hypothetical protein [Bacillus subtilis]